MVSVLPRWAWIAIALVAVPAWAWLILGWFVEGPPQAVESFAYLSLTVVLGIQLIETFLEQRRQDRGSPSDEPPSGSSSR